MSAFGGNLENLNWVGFIQWPRFVELGEHVGCVAVGKSNVVPASAPENPPVTTYVSSQTGQWLCQISS